MAQVSHPKHDIHKFRDIKPKLGRDNWVSWKRELLATARDRGLYATILGTDPLPSRSDPNFKIVDNIPCIQGTPLSQLTDEWYDRNNTAYNQILLCISPELQTAIDDTDEAAKAWKILTKKFESTDPSKISIIRTRYENYHMVEGQSVVSYITSMKEFRSQLKKMGEHIADSTHAATLLRNLPESWRPISQTIRMIAHTPDDIEERLEAHEADLNALEVSNQAATAFSARARPTRPNSFIQPRQHNPQPNTPRTVFHCNNCGKTGHPASKCYAPGGGLAGQAPWMTNPNAIPISTTIHRPPVTQHRNATPTNQDNATSDPSVRLASQGLKDMVMMAKIDEPSIEPNITILTDHAALSSSEDKAHLWLVDSAASSHLSGNRSLFISMYDIKPITIETASGESFTANQRGSIRMRIVSDPTHDLPDLPVTLIDVIYAPKLQANLLSVGRMTNSNLDVAFSKDRSFLTLNGKILAYGMKTNNLFTYMTLPPLPNQSELAEYTAEPAEIVLWHHRLAHTGYSTLESMKRMKTVAGFHPSQYHGSVPQCTNCPFGKQTRIPFRNTEDLPAQIGDIIASDICGPFDLSVAGYRYFVTWIDLKSRYASIDFLKNKECTTITESFKKYVAWIQRQKKTLVKKVRTDNGGEYIGREFKGICEELGIIHETTSPYTPEHNGITERYNRTLQEGALTLQHDAGLSNKFWVSAVHTVNFIKNRILHKRIEKSPYEAFWGSKPKVDWLRTYGCKCWALVPKAVRRKGQYKSVEGIFVGYFDDSKAYKVWVPRTHTILKARDVIFDESNHIERVTIHATDDDDLPNLWTDEIDITTTPSHIPAQQNNPIQIPDTGETHNTSTVTEDEQARETTPPEMGQDPQGKEAEMQERGYVYGNPFLFNTLWLKPLSSGYPTIHTITPKTL